MQTHAYYATRVTLSLFMPLYCETCITVHLNSSTFNKTTAAIFFNCLNSIASTMIINLHWFPIFCIYIAASQGPLRTLACHYCPTVLNWCVDGYATHYSSNLVLDWIHLSCCCFLVSTNLWQQNPGCADGDHLIILRRCLLYLRKKHSIADHTEAFSVVRTMMFWGENDGSVFRHNFETHYATGCIGVLLVSLFFMFYFFRISETISSLTVFFNTLFYMIININHSVLNYSTD